MRSRGEAARNGGVGLQTVHDWVLCFNARGPDGLIDAEHPGPRPKLNAEQRAALERLVENGPQPAIYGVVRWRLKDLVAWIQEEFTICMDETTLGRTLRATIPAGTGPPFFAEPLSSPPGFCYAVALTRKLAVNLHRMLITCDTPSSRKADTPPSKKTPGTPQIRYFGIVRNKSELGC